MLEALRDFPRRHPSWAYVAPFVVFMAVLSLGPTVGPAGLEILYPFRVAATVAAGLVWSRRVLNFRVRNALGSAAVGIAVFLLWIAPDLLWPGYRSHWLFQNALTGPLASSLAEHHRSSAAFLLWRGAGLVIVVPVIEELFWRAWLMRYVIARRFEGISLGTYSSTGFWITAVLFAAEHGPFWDVGLVAGVAYNAWMVKSRSLGDCILAHAVTNACLGAYVLWSGRWEYLL